mgnify:FL=1
MILPSLLEISKARAIEDVWTIYTKIMDNYGFDRIIYGRTLYRSGTNLGDPSEFLVLSNHDPSYIEAFVTQERYIDSPMFHWSFDNEGCASWSMVQEMAAKGELTAKELEVVVMNQEYDVTAGFTFSFPRISHRAKSSASLTAKNGISQQQADEIWAKHSDELEILNYVVDLKISTLPYFSQNKSLTKRQREVLEWIGDGKTTQDTAIILGLTPATVEKHLRLARENLNVDTTAQAVLKASFLNQMFLIENLSNRKKVK